MLTDAEYMIGDDIQAVILHTLVLCKQIIFSVDTGVIASVKNDDVSQYSHHIILSYCTLYR